MKKNKITFLILECIFLILTLFFAWKILTGMCRKNEWR